MTQLNNNACKACGGSLQDGFVRWSHHKHMTWNEKLYELGKRSFGPDDRICLDCAGEATTDE